MAQGAEDEEGIQYCPGCGGEYRAGFTRCVDCDLDFVPDPPRLSPRLSYSTSAEPADPSAFAAVFVTGDLDLVAQAKSLLDGAAIPYLAHGEERNQLFVEGRLAPDARAEPMELQVPAGQWRTAATLLDQAGLAPVTITPDEQGVGEGWDSDEGEEGDDEPEEAAAETRPAPWSPTEDRLRAWELALVLLVAFSSSLFSSTVDWWTGEVGPHNPSALGSLYNIQRQLVCLGLLAYVLWRRGKTFRDLGLGFRPADIPAGLLLGFAGYLAQRLAWQIMDWGAVVVAAHPIPFPRDDIEAATGLALIMHGIFSIFVTPTYEELIARAFTMTEVEALTGSTALAIFASVALQTSYHLYLGTANALAAGATFLVSACFYARFRRITPVILAHAFWNLYVIVGRL